VILSSGASVAEFRHGTRVLLVPKVYPDLARTANLESVARHNGLHLVWVKEPPGLFAERWTAERLESEYQRNDRLHAFYRDILGLQQQLKPATVLVMGDGGYWHRQFLQQLKALSFVAFWTGDDPEGSAQTSRPFVGYYDYAFCGGVFFDQFKRIDEKFVEWGAPVAKFIPLGACPDKYYAQGNRTDEAFFSTQRDIDVIYVGAAYKGKLWRVLMLKRHFKDRLYLGGKRWNGVGLGWKGIAVRLFSRLGGLGEIREVTDADLVGLYQRAKVGFNCHLSYGPSNLRTYELPLNGVLQVCDCEEGLRELYTVGREVLAYKGMRGAIAAIEHYLHHESERFAIAKAGYHRAMQEYRMEGSFAKLLAAVDARTPVPGGALP
jgi:spore maturation protein CgeB